MSELTFDIAEVHHDGKHHMNLSIKKNSNTRCTWCSRCMEAVLWERVNKIELNQSPIEQEGGIECGHGIEIGIVI